MTGHFVRMHSVSHLRVYVIFVSTLQGIQMGKRVYFAWHACKFNYVIAYA